MSQSHLRSPGSTGLITRRSQVQILPPLLERPWKRGLFAWGGRAPAENFCPTFARGDFTSHPKRRRHADSGQNYSDGRAGQVTAPSCRGRWSVSLSLAERYGCHCRCVVCPFTLDEFRCLIQSEISIALQPDAAACCR